MVYRFPSLLPFITAHFTDCVLQRKHCVFTFERFWTFFKYIYRLLCMATGKLHAHGFGPSLSTFLSMVNAGYWFAAIFDFTQHKKRNFPSI